MVFLGTSLTAGYGVDPTQAFPARIQALIDASGLQFHVVNAGVSGETSTGARQRIDWVLESIQGPLALLVLETGANDGLRGQDPDALRDNLDAIIARVRARPDPPRILLVGMEALPNLGADYARRFRGIYPEVARRLRVRLLPFLLEGVGGVDSLNQGDGIHPNPVGHQRVAEHLWTVLHPLLDSLSASG